MVVSNGSTPDRLDSTKLLALAREIDPSISERTLEHWRYAGLLPHAERSGQNGKKPVWTYPASTAAHLSTLLRLRQRTRDQNAIRVALWYSGYPVETGRIRESISAFLRGLLAGFEKEINKSHPGATSDPELRWRAIQALAATLARKRGPGVPRYGRQALGERTAAFASALGLLLNDQTALRRLELDASAVERLIGADKGRRYRPVGTAPWLDGAPEEWLGTFAQTGGIPWLIAVTEGATDRQLETARDFARPLMDGLAAFTQLADAMSGRANSSGMVAVRMLHDEPLAAAVIVPLLLSLLASPEISQNLEMILSAIRSSVIPVEEQVRTLASLSKDERAQKLGNLSNLPFAQQLQITRLIDGST